MGMFLKTRTDRLAWSGISISVVVKLNLPPGSISLSLRQMVSLGLISLILSLTSGID